MTNRLIIFLAIVSIGVFTVLSSCNKGNETKISSHGSHESHNTGQNCMNCHKSGGEGEGHFTVAGTVYDSTFTTPQAGGTVKIYSQPNGGGTLVATVEVDDKGNFYTTESINMSAGVYNSVTALNGNVHFMGDISTNGACNSCHGISQDRIWAQ